MGKEQNTEERLVTEIFKELKAYGKRWFIIAMVELGIILAMAGTIIYVSYFVPVEDTTSTKTESYDIDSQDNGNAIYNDSGKVNVNGEDKNTKNDND